MIGGHVDMKNEQWWHIDRAEAIVITLKPVSSLMNLTLSSLQEPAHREK